VNNNNANLFLAEATARQLIGDDDFYKRINWNGCVKRINLNHEL